MMLGFALSPMAQALRRASGGAAVVGVWLLAVGAWDDFGAWDNDSNWIDGV